MTTQNSKYMCANMINLPMCISFAGFCNGSNNDNGETPPVQPLPCQETPIRGEYSDHVTTTDQSEASPSREAEEVVEAAAAASSADNSERTSERKSSSEGSEEQNNDHHQRDIFRDLSDHDEDTEDTSLQCDHCSDKFMSETSMRIHAVRCSRSRQQSEQPNTDTEMPRTEDIRRSVNNKTKCLKLPLSEVRA